MSFGTLKVTYRNGRQDTVELEKAAMSLGSGADNDVVLRDPFVDLHHAEVRCTERGCQVLDLGSATGTIVNGSGLSPNVAGSLRDGAVIEIGRVTLTFHAPAAAVKGDKAKVKQPRRRAAPPAPAARRRLPRRPFFFAEAVVIVLAAVVLGGVLLRPYLSRTSVPASGAAPVSVATAAPTLPSAIATQGQARLYVVTTAGGRRLNVRAAPSQTAAVVGQLGNGAAVRAIEGPVPGGGLTWVRIEGGGVAGWCVLDGLRPR